MFLIKLRKLPKLDPDVTVLVCHLQFGSETSGNFDDIRFSNVTCTLAGKVSLSLYVSTKYLQGQAGYRLGDCHYKGL